jgi:hypothetical protein
MRSDAAFCIGAKTIGEAWTPNETSDVPQARIKANTLDIGKTPKAFPSILIGRTVFKLRGLSGFDIAAAGSRPPDRLITSEKLAS